MVMEDEKNKLVQDLYDAVLNMDEDRARELSNIIISSGVDAYQAVTRGLTAAMDRAGELYINQEYFVPELLLCSDALYASLEILRPHIKTDREEKKRQIVIGTVQGDIHDIGKNLVKIMFEAAGWVIHDLGRDVEISRFAAEQEKTKSDIVAISTLMTTSMLAMPAAIDLIRKKDSDVVIMLGGAPLTPDIAKSYGADGYAENAAAAVKAANAILSGLGR